jgi:hypothetical protein
MLYVRSSMLECGNAGFDPLQTWDVQCNRPSGCRTAGVPAD